MWISGCVASPIRARVQVNPPVSQVLHFAYEVDMATLDRIVPDCSRFKADGAVIEVEGLPTQQAAAVDERRSDRGGVSIEFAAHG